MEEKLPVDRLGETNSLAAVIKDRVPSTDEDIAPDPLGSASTLDAGLADGGTTESLLLENVDRVGDAVGGTADGEGQIGQVGDTSAAGGDVNVLEDGVDHAAGAHDEGGSRVDNGDAARVAAVGVNVGAADLDVVEHNGVVVASVEVELVVGDGAREVVAVVATEGEDGRVASRLGVEVEGEHRVDAVLLDSVVEEGGHVVGGDGLVSQTKDAIERRASEESGQGGGLSELLLGDLESTDGHIVVQQGAFHGTGA